MDAHADDACAERTARIAALNDRLRQTGTGGRTMLSQAVAALPPQMLSALLEAVRNFDTFDTANQWRDFGCVNLGREIFIFQVVCYDLELEFGSPDPADEARTCRVLTIMTAADY